MIIVFLFYKKDKKDIIIVMNKQKSFTLIELLVVIVIIGILAGVITISTSSSIDKANIAKSKVFEESVQNNLAANMVSAWDGDHVTKSTAWLLDDKWGNNNGTFYDGALTTCSTTACPQIITDSQMGNVLSFDGVNDYIDCGSNGLNISGNKMTMTAWFNPKTLDGNDYILSKYDSGLSSSYGMGATGYNNLKYYVITTSSGDYSKTPSYSVPVNKWSFFAVTYNGSAIVSYVNGILIASDPMSGNIATTTATVKIGRISSYYTSGLINDVRIYDATLSSFQIKQNYIAGLDSLLSDGNISKEDYNQRINLLAHEK